MAMPTKLYCLKCDRLVDIKDFYFNYSEHCENRYKRMDYCKACCKELGDYVFSKYDSFELALRELCSLVKLPFVYDVMIKLKEKEETSRVDRKDTNKIFQYKNLLEEYLKDLTLSEENTKKFLSNLSCNSFLHINLLKIAKPTTDGDNDLFLELEKTWGKKDRLDDYLLLEDKFSIYTEGETLTPAMINTIRYLCQAELDVIKLKESKSEQKDISDAEKRVMGYYKTLKLDEFKFNKEKTVAEKMLENWIFIEENYEPLEWEDENLKDRCGFKSDNDDIMRSLGNKLLGNRDFPQLDTSDLKKKKK